ncbi:type I-C CRISPR-associated protein Cas5c [Sporosarcina highlanderae]|uniref:pre-crRNA processing endonuclease n=1 Tax=Sporosarcina highlanderae TaxID=3035916 RepID=A0ABT8JNS6_9BACL|nr:type I-C CRISPR-associated protein Cas5c [Sporosarcina highlanderae]MDN4606804.1 type I-C CRISPR-associated protein Cas5c [Sporosarcina highlanderae]
MRKTTKVQVKVWGDGALFTRPEGKVERVSYPLMTASAARGILEAILWKPEFRYRICSISVLKPPIFHSIVRNEVENKATITKKFIEQPEDRYADDMRQLRHSLYLKDAAYIIRAEIVLQPDTQQPIEKYEAMFTRRIQKGQCFSRPYLGTREFSANFGPVSATDTPIKWTEEIGPMFFDYRYPQNGTTVIPFFFNASVQDGVMHIPEHLFEEVKSFVR